MSALPPDAAAPPRHCLSDAELLAWPPERLHDDGLTPMERGRRRMVRSGQWGDWQMLGRRMAIGCVALEVTQRCNLDCSYCYLSAASQALKDLPIEEVFRRIDLIHAHYGAGTDIQVTGGEPTLRSQAELVAIVARIRALGMRASLFTNGIKATRPLLAALRAAGLEDVAFHVDMTQGRPGYDSEAALDALREALIERARGLGLSVFFNTTAFPGNFHELPALVRFFVRHADVVRLASFQLGADTGRGSGRERVAVTTETVIEAIREGAGTHLDFGAAGAGHAECNRYAYGLIVNGRLHDFFADAAFVRRVLGTSAGLRVDRADTRRLGRRVARHLLARPALLWGVLRRAAVLAWTARRDLLAARGRIGKLSFFVHNFMDAGALDAERCEACSFMVMTPEGPLSMCVHNAKRDAYLLVPARVERERRLLYFDPVSGRLQEQLPDRIEVRLTAKTARGRAKEALQPAPAEAAAPR